MLARRLPRPCQAGAVTLLLCGTLLLMVVLIAAATLQMLLSGRQLAVMQRERELAFRAAEAALRDGEAELLAAAASPDTQDRLSLWPAPGRCGSGQQAGLCRPALAGPPVWQPWLRADTEVDAIGVPLGRFTGAALPADAAVQEPPRYVAEILDEAPAGHSAPDFASALDSSPRMRVTAVGFGRNRAVRALLQSVIQP
ncbi:pilus assembly protein [Cupriavidus taiwanensis]|uniref:Type IV pilus assembly protein PilX n=1 Tax=Cupriavidus taiwanensis TaxID=164546 RepID=A0A375IZU2_9BURK|nr:pilus assembly protein [Cupriavidus taiwanensis]SPR97881.1 Type IV pilus assembly protein PilX [Cupriavidus taiwanensis]